MRYEKYSDFYVDYIRQGIIAALVITLIGLLLGSIIFGTEWDNRRTEIQLYKALQGENIANATTIQAASIIKDMANGNDPKTNIPQGLKELSNIYSGPFFVLLFSQKGESILKLAAEDSQDAVISVTAFSWKSFFLWASLCALIILIGCMSFNFAVTSLEEDESLFDWPWNKLWVYPVFLTMLPALIFFMIIEVVYRAFMFIRTLSNKREKAEQTTS